MQACQSTRSRIGKGRHLVERGDELADAVEAIRRGDQSGWRVLHRHLDPLARRVAALDYRLNAADTEDVSQTVWSKLFTHIDTIDEPRALRSWVRTTATRECIRLVSRCGRQREVLTEDSSERLPRDGDTEIRLDVERREIIDGVRRALGSLPSDRRILLAELFREDADAYADIASRLHVPVGSIGPTRGRILDALRRHPAVMALAH